MEGLCLVSALWLNTSWFLMLFPGSLSALKLVLLEESLSQKFLFTMSSIGLLVTLKEGELTCVVSVRRSDLLQ